MSYAVFRWLVVAVASALCTGAFAYETQIAAPNVVTISPTLVTSGQPTIEALSRLANQGFSAVVYLAPKTVEGAIPSEEEIVRSQGLEFVNIPIPFGQPTNEDFQAFVVTMQKLKNRKVLVHCEVNMRASTMTFLYRVIVNHEKADAAYESVAKVWSPRGPWKRLIISELREENITFEPY